jgi:hypothetical protein
MLFFGAVIYQVKLDERVARTQKSLRETLNIDEVYVSRYDWSFLGIRFDRNMLVIGNPKFRKEYMFSEVASVDIIKNNVSVTSTNRGSQLLGAAVGGIALGGVGLLAGALTGTKRTKSRTKEIGIKIVVDDRMKPIHYIKLFTWHEKNRLEDDSDLLEPVVALAERFNAHLVNGMRRAAQAREEQLRVSAPAMTPLPTTTTYAEQEKQLWDLHLAGALSMEEFQQQKALLAPLAPHN